MKKILRFPSVPELQSITGAALVIGASSLLSRILGVLRERMLVGTFGVGDKLDVYYASFQAPNFLYNLLILGTLSVAFIPVFVEWYERDQKEAWKISSAIFNTTALVMGVFSLVLFFGASFFTHLVAPGFVGEKFEMAVQLTKIMAFSPFLFAISSVFGSVLNARRRFVITALAPLLYNIAIIGGIVYADTFGGSIYPVAVSVVIGACAHGLLQWSAARAEGFCFARGFFWKHSGVKTVRRLFIPRIWGIDISQIALIIGSNIGSTLMVGSVALFNLANNIQTVPVGVLGVPFAIAAFPVFSSAIAKGEHAEFRAVFSRTMRQIIFFLLPLTVITIVLRAHIIRLVIGVQRLSWDDTRLAAATLALFAVSFFLQGITPLLSRAFYALKNTWIPVVVSGIAVIVDIAFSYLFVQILGSNTPFVQALSIFLRLDGVRDIRLLALPAAFSLASLVQAILLGGLLRAKYGSLDLKRISLSFAKTGAASIVALFVTRLSLYGATLFTSDRTFLGVLAQISIASFCGIVAYLLVACLFRSEEANIFLHSFRRKILKISKPLGIGDTTGMT